VRAASSYDEHFDQVMTDLLDPAPAQRAAETFVRSFVRPLGHDQSASASTAAAITGALPRRPVQAASAATRAARGAMS
jgi:hypothetical protein